MAELVDALGSGPSAGNGVEVRVLFWAPIHQVANALQRGLRRTTRQENSRFGGIFFAHTFSLPRQTRQSFFSHKPLRSRSFSLHEASVLVCDTSVFVTPRWP